MLNLYNDLIKLMDKIEQKWLKYNYAAENFCNVVWDETEHLDLTPLGEITNQLQLMDLHAVRQQQHRSTFSDFHFQIFHNGRFLIEILNWWGSHVNVHDHDFSGVQFQVKGDALNVVYDFPETVNLGAIRFGELKVRRAEFWKEGGRSLVRHGNIDPHSVLHLSSPTTSLLIRTVPTARFGAQSNYFPTLAAHYYVNSEVQRKKLTALALLAKKSPDAFCEHWTNFSKIQSLSENFFMLLKLGDVIFKSKYVHLVKEFAERGEYEKKIVQSVAYNNAIDFLKTQGNLILENSEEAKLTVFAVAAAHGLENYRKIESDLKNSSKTLQPQKHFETFLSKLDDKSKSLALRYFDLFELAKLCL